jgi:hypothetical protein
LGLDLEGEMADVEFVLALEQRIELVPLRRGWWVTESVARRVGIAQPWGRMIGYQPKEGVMLAVEGAA